MGSTRVILQPLLLVFRMLANRLLEYQCNLPHCSLMFLTSHLFQCICLLPICSNKVFLFLECLGNLICGVLFGHYTVRQRFLPNVQYSAMFFISITFLFCSLFSIVSVCFKSETRHHQCRQGIFCMYGCYHCLFLFDLLYWFGFFFSNYEEISLFKKKGKEKKKLGGCGACL